MTPDPEPPVGEGTDDAPFERGVRPKKAATAFRTISEVADDLHVPQHVLRFWETRFPQVKPLKRGGGRRYYRPDDVVLLRRIADLLYIQGYTIKGVQRLLVEGDGTLQGDLPPPEMTEADEDPASPLTSPMFELPAAEPEPARADPVAASRMPPPAALEAHDAMRERQAVQALLSQILAELEAMRRQLPV